MDEKTVMECLKQLGFRPKVVPDYGVLFCYDGVNMVYQREEDDPDFFKIMAPYIYEIEDENERPFLLDAVNDVNVRIKYAKAMISGDNVYVSFEYRVFVEDDALAMVRFCIQLLHAAVTMFRRVLKGGEIPRHPDDTNIPNP